MSVIKVSDYLFFLKTCDFGQVLLKKAYSNMQRLYQGLLLEAEHERGSSLKALKDLSPWIEGAIASMAVSYLPFLEQQLLQQQARAECCLIPIWDYALVLNDQQNIHALLSQGDAQLSSLLSRLAHHYRLYGWTQGIFWVEQLQKQQAAAQFVNEKISLALQKTQAVLDKISLRDAKGMRTFGACILDLKGGKPLGSAGRIAQQGEDD